MDHLENAGEIREHQLRQTVNLQRESWEARRAQLQSRKESWVRRMELIKARGQDQWAVAENAFLARWYEAQREERSRMQQSSRLWEDRIRSHFRNRSEWEEQMNLQLAEKSMREEVGSIIGELNQHIQRNNESLQAQIPRISRDATIQRALEELKEKSLQSEDVSEIKGIDEFHSRIESELRRADLGQSNIYEAGRNFRSHLDRHQKRMKTMARSQILEQYRDLIQKFVESIQERNDAYKGSTRSAALSAGFVEMGPVFIKRGLGSKNVGAVNPINPFDIQSRAQRFRSRSDIFASEEEFQRIMRSSSLPEFEAKIKMAKLKARSWMKDISGDAKKGSEMRGDDCSTLGEFGCWMGRASDNKTNRMASAMAGRNSKSLTEASRNAKAAGLLKMFAEGLGELGGKSRPGAPGVPGFYLQMRMMNAKVAKENGENISGRGPFIDPASGAMNRAHLGLVQAYHNTEIDTKVRGLDRGALTRGNATVLGVSAARSLAMVGDITGGAGGLSAAVGILSSGIKTNLRTGESRYEFRTGEFLGPATQIGSSFLPAGWGEAVASIGTGIQQAYNEYQREQHTTRALAKGALRGVNHYTLGRVVGGDPETGKGAMISSSGNAFASGFAGSLLSSAGTDVANASFELALSTVGLSSSYNASIQPGLNSWNSIIGGAFNAGLMDRLKSDAQKSRHAKIQRAWEAARKAREENRKQTTLDVMRGLLRDEELAQKLAQRFNDQYAKTAVKKALEVRNRMKGRNSREGRLSTAADVAAAEIINQGHRDIQEKCYREIDSLSRAAGMSIAEAAELVIRKYGGDPKQVLSQRNMQNLSTMDQQWHENRTGAPGGSVSSDWGFLELLGALQGDTGQRDSSGVDSSHPLARKVRAGQMHKYYEELRVQMNYSGLDLFQENKLGRGLYEQDQHRRRNWFRTKLDERFGKGSYQEYLIYREKMQAELDEYAFGQGFVAQGYSDEYRESVRFLKSLGYRAKETFLQQFNGKSLEQLTADIQRYDNKLDAKAAARKKALEAKIANAMQGKGLATRAVLAEEIQSQYRTGQVLYEASEIVATELVTFGAAKALSAGKLAFRGMQASKAGANAHKLRVGMGVFNKFRRSGLAARIGSNSVGRAVLNQVYRNKYTLNSMAINGTASGLTKIPLDMTISALQGEEYTLKDGLDSFGQGFFTGAGSSGIGGLRILNDTGKIIGNGVFLAGNEIYRTMPEFGWEVTAERGMRVLIQGGFGAGSQALGIQGSKGSAPLNRFEKTYRKRQANELLMGTITPIPFDLTNDTFWEVVWPRIQKDQ